MDRVHCYLLIMIYCMFSIVSSDDESLQCKDEDGNAVDWYVLYKIPKVRESSDPGINKGVKYLYITSQTTSNGWQPSDKEITFADSIPGKTLAPLYKSNVASQALWILYNDQPPQKAANAGRGHAKGVLMTDANQGFWLIHTVPNYPPTASDTDSKYDYPSSGTRNGQSFLCISFNSDQMNTIGLQMMYNQIISYQYNLPEDLSQQYPNLVKASQKQRIEGPPYNQKSELTSTNGQQFVSFAKSDKWQKELYGEFVAPQLESNLYAQTWQNGVGKLQSYCQRPRVLNVQSIKLDVVNVFFQSTNDHSKWAVATNNRNDKNWVCIGDINRASTQKNRGGGAVCINSLELWNNYHSAVNDYESCS